ncbi:MAG: phosphatase, partial [Actinomycetota bacterium]|nr:phosphatase [Actinomycetota bacterium]
MPGSTRGATIRVAPDEPGSGLHVGDDEVFDYVYKFVPTGGWCPPTAPGAYAEPAAARLRHVVCREVTGNSPYAQIDGSGLPPVGGAFDGTG